MPRYKLTVAYDGTDFCGWQKQYPHAGGAGNEWTDFRADDPPEIFDRGVKMWAPERAATVEAEAGVASPTKPVTMEGKAEEAGVDDRARMELRTVQAVLERAIRLVVRQPVVLVGASRTDSGVHARGQVCAFTTQDREAAELASDTEPGIVSETDMRGGANEPGKADVQGGVWKRGVPEVTNFQRWGGGWPRERGTEALVRAINSRLPGDVLVRSAEAAEQGFDPISGATSKAYSYTIFNSRQRPLWERRRALHVWHALDPARMNEAAKLFVGEHDFAGFAAAGHGRATTVRTVFGCSVRSSPVEGVLPGEVDGQIITIDISGSGFLWNMVRIIAGTLMEAGKSDVRKPGEARMGLEQVRRAIETGDRRLAGPTSPAHGLCLEWIRYTDEDRGLAGAGLRVEG